MSSGRVLSYANLDFEEELASSGRYQRSLAMLSIMGRWRYLLRLVPGAEEAECLGPGGFQGALLGSRGERDVPRGTREESSGGYRQLIPWGVTPSTLALARGLGLEAEFPTLEAVRRVNDKRFSHALEQELGVALPHARLVHSWDELGKAVEECPHDWVLKHPFGVSGRERALGKKGVVSESARGWAKRRFGRGWSLVFEPWVEDKSEFSLHFELSPTGTIEFLGQTLLRSDASGVYRGNAVLPGYALEPSLLESGQKIAERVALEGYFGPLGIDGMVGRLGEAVRLRPLTEINARLSFGRMAIHLGRLVPAGWCYRWWHPRAAATEPGDRIALPVLGEENFGAQNRPGIYRLPEWLDPQKCGQSLVLIAPDAAALEQIETQLE